MLESKYLVTIENEGDERLLDATAIMEALTSEAMRVQEVRGEFGQFFRVRVHSAK